MQILEWKAFLEEGLPIGNNFAAMTVGVFDGVHRGHKALIERILSGGRQILPVVISFRENHKKPGGGDYPGDITSFGQKAAVFESLGVAVMVAADLTESFRRMKGGEFLNLLRERGKMGFLAVGCDFRCGHRLDTDAHMIQMLNDQEGIRTEIVEAVLEAGVPISSSRIRNAIRMGNFREAELMLGRPFSYDLSGAEEISRDVPDGEFTSYTAVPDRVLPPPGTYTVILHEKNGAKKKAEIEIGEGIIRLPQGGGWECMEFSINGKGEIT